MTLSKLFDEKLKISPQSSTFLQIFLGMLLVYQAARPKIFGEKLKTEHLMLPLGGKGLNGTTLTYIILCLMVTTQVFNFFSQIFWVHPLVKQLMWPHLFPPWNKGIIDINTPSIHQICKKTDMDSFKCHRKPNLFIQFINIVSNRFNCFKLNRYKLTCITVPRSI